MVSMKYISAFLAAAVLLSCTGTVDDSSLPVLEASDTEIDLASESQTVFTVTYNGMDVTSGSSIISTPSAPGLNGNVFTPTSEGTFVFHAVYNGKESEQVTVNVVNSDVRVE